MEVKTKITTTVVKENRLELSAETIIGVLNRAGYKIPMHADVTVTVPGGGDWSNSDLPISKPSPLVVEWSESDTTER